ncbi:MAG: ribosomal-protein-alanine N-acetyltransferase [SAR202 cluster bacterium Io17-Chloro-G9]|nr:MAG: ribosomal-protein-alanine N-acetyltransferase [SAR202 cluster bacterium Io17-Chloro-G9]
MDVSLRRLRTEDINQVIEIEKEAFSPLWISTPFKRELNNRYACYLVACPAPDEVDPAPFLNQDHSGLPLWERLSKGMHGLMGRSGTDAAADELIAGYVSVWFQGEEAHITEIAVREKLRGRGIGELLLIGAVRAAKEYGSKVLTLEARVSNFVAQRLYEKYDFKQVGIRKGYYSDNREDAVILTTSPIDTEEYQRMFQELQDTFRSRWGEILIDA